MNKDMIATQLLYDIGVLLEENYADPEREVFPFLQPAFSLDPHTPFGQRFFSAFAKSDLGQQTLIRAGLAEALQRCCAQWLGLWRGLDVFDLHQMIAPEALSSDMKRQLIALRSTEHPDQRAIWIDQLLGRWHRLKIYPDLPLEYWSDSVTDSTPETLPATLTYLTDGPLRKKVEALKCLSVAKQMSSKWSTEGLLSADQLSTLPMFIQQLEKDTLPSLSVETAESAATKWMPTLDLQMKNERNELLKLIEVNDFYEPFEAANDKEEFDALELAQG